MKRRQSAEAGAETGKAQGDRNEAVCRYYQGERTRGLSHTQAAKGTAEWLASFKLEPGWRQIGWRQVAEVVKRQANVPHPIS